METFLAISTSFPVIVYTLLMFVIICYWLLAMIGSVEIEALDMDADIDLDADVDPEGLSGVTGFMVKWGLTGVPVTVVFSILIASAWLICYFGVSITATIITSATFNLLFKIFWLIFSFVLAIVFTSWMISPLKKMFVSHSAAEKSSFVGNKCQVKTRTVTNDFGQAEMEDGGAGMLFDIRADEAYGIKKGDWVMLVEYDEEKESYKVKKI